MFTDIYFFLKVWMTLHLLTTATQFVLFFFKKNKNTSCIGQIDLATDCTREANSACHLKATE